MKCNQEMEFDHLVVSLLFQKNNEKNLKKYRKNENVQEESIGFSKDRREGSKGSNSNRKTI